MTDKRGTWGSGIGSLVIAVGIALSIRWLLIEAYVIPSGSMLPTLLIQDHIFVNKIVYGIRWPFSKKWIFHFGTPKRGDVLIFRYPQDESTFFVKRVVGVPGDKVSWDGRQLTINDEKIAIQELADKDRYYNLMRDFEIAGGRDSYEFLEEIPTQGKNHPVLIKNDSIHETFENISVPADSLFVLGDNRDNSHDSRFWGFVPMENILGRAMFVWLSCEDTLPGPASFLCNPSSIRWGRFFHNVR